MAELEFLTSVSMLRTAVERYSKLYAGKESVFLADLSKYLKDQVSAALNPHYLQLPDVKVLQDLRTNFSILTSAGPSSLQSSARQAVINRFNYALEVVEKVQTERAAREAELAESLGDAGVVMNKVSEVQAVLLERKYEIIEKFPDFEERADYQALVAADETLGKLSDKIDDLSIKRPERATQVLNTVLKGSAEEIANRVVQRELARTQNSGQVKADASAGARVWQSAKVSSHLKEPATTKPDAGKATAETSRAERMAKVAEASPKSAPKPATPRPRANDTAYTPESPRSPGRTGQG